MPVTHTMTERQNWENDFATDEHAILLTPYQPEVLILGTYNPNTVQNNVIADFFYGRNYFWPAFSNLVNNDPVQLLQQRRTGHLPVLSDVFNLCTHFKLSFADLILEVMHNDANYNLHGNTVHFNGQDYNLIEDDALLQLHQLNQVNWNTTAIVNYLINTPSIHTVYITRQPIGLYLEQWQIISGNQNYGRDISFRKIYTPRGSRLQGTPRVAQLTDHWLHNVAANYQQIDNDWLLQKGVNPNNFAM